jgi:crotonyl-CoA carboxylase/reductase
MYENRHPHGNMSVLVGAKELGLGVSSPLAMVSSAGRSTPVEPEDEYARPRAEPDPEGVVTDEREVRELMHAGVLTCGMDATVQEMGALLLSHKIHALVVEEEGSAVGVVSQTDLVLARQGRRPEVFRAMRAREIMSPDLVSCEAGTRIAEAITMMTRRRIHRLVVVEEVGGKRVPLGVVSMTDIVRSMMGEEAQGGVYEDPA